MTSSERWKTFACFLLIHAAAFSGSATEIRLKPNATSGGAVVMLRDVADVIERQPLSAGTDARQAVDDATSLGGILLFPAPDKARPRVVRRHEVRELLALHGVDWMDVQITGAPAVVVAGHDGRERARAAAGPGMQASSAVQHALPWGLFFPQF